MSGTDNNGSRQTWHMVILHKRHSGHQDKEHTFQDSPGVSTPIEEKTGEHRSMSPAHLYLAGGLALMCLISPPWWRRTFLLTMTFSSSKYLMWMWVSPSRDWHVLFSAATRQVHLRAHRWGPLTITGPRPEWGLLPAPLPSYRSSSTLVSLSFNISLVSSQIIML